MDPNLTDTQVVNEEAVPKQKGSPLGRKLGAGIFVIAMGYAAWQIGALFFGSGTRTSATSSSSASNSIPQACVGKRVSLSGLSYNPTDKYSACDGYGVSQCDNLLKVAMAGNYQVVDVVLNSDAESGKQYCHAKLSIAGVVDGNSYSGEMWALAL